MIFKWNYVIRCKWLHGLNIIKYWQTKKNKYHWAEGTKLNMTAQAANWIRHYFEIFIEICNKQTKFYKTLVSCSGWNEYCCSNKSIGFSFDLFELALKTTPIKNPCFNTTRWYGVMWLLQCGLVWFGVAWCLCIISLFVQTMYHFCLNTHKLHVFPI